jgi:hypothetical protein
LKSFAPAHSAGILPAFGLAKRRTTRFETTTSTFSRRDRHHCADQSPVDLKLLQRRLRIQFTAQATI